MEATNNSGLIYLFFLLFLTITCFFKNTKTKAIIITVLFILVFICAETGADYVGYKYIYENSLTSQVHGEILYVSICKLFNLIGCSYNLFRIIFLSTFFSLFCFSLFKITNNYSLSFIFAYLMYIIYFVSAYRQLATIAIFLFSIYLFYYKNYKITSILLNFVAIFIHGLAIVQFIFMLVAYIYERINKKKKSVEKKFLKKWFYLILIFCLIIRIIVFIAITKTRVGDVYETIVNYPEVSLINFGLISRLVILVVLTHFYTISKKDKNIDAIFSIYFIGIMLYILMPAELIMGRLINNFKILEIILIPMLLFKNFKFKYMQKNEWLLKICQLILIVVACAVFTSQMINQGGYNYYHMIMGVIV